MIHTAVLWPLTGGGAAAVNGGGRCDKFVRATETGRRFRTIRERVQVVLRAHYGTVYDAYVIILHMYTEIPGVPTGNPTARAPELCGQRRLSNARIPRATANDRPCSPPSYYFAGPVRSSKYRARLRIVRSVNRRFYGDRLRLGHYVTFVSDVSSDRINRPYVQTHDGKRTKPENVFGDGWGAWPSATRKYGTGGEYNYGTIVQCN